MRERTAEPKPVPSWARVLAWIIVACSCLAAISVATGLPDDGVTALPWRKIVPFALLAAWILPPFWIVALTGKPPKRWPALGTLLWQSDPDCDRRER